MSHLEGTPRATAAFIEALRSMIPRQTTSLCPAKAATTFRTEGSSNARYGFGGLDDRNGHDGGANLGPEV
jgi:hypothetical protein